MLLGATAMVAVPTIPTMPMPIPRHIIQVSARAGFDSIRFDFIRFNFV